MKKPIKSEYECDGMFDYAGYTEELEKYIEHREAIHAKDAELTERLKGDLDKTQNLLMALASVSLLNQEPIFKLRNRVEKSLTAYKEAKKP